MTGKLKLLLSALLLFNIGCASITMPPKEKVAADIPVSNKSTSRVAGPPVRMAVIWKEKLLQTSGRPAVRGFTGRLYFYDHHDNPVQVDGELTVYGYDDSDGIRKEVADRKYVFPADKFSGRYSQSEIGHSYTVWIPWEQHGGIRKAITLVPLFQTQSGQMVQGVANRVALTGRDPTTGTFSKSNASREIAGHKNTRQQIQQSAATQATVSDHPQRRAAESIPIPEALAQRIANLPPSRVTSNLPRTRLAAESRETNPHGDLYNRVHFSRTVVGGESELAAPDRGPTFSNFSDSAAVQQPTRRNTAAQPESARSPVYGKPGAFR